MNYIDIIFEKADGIGFIRMNRPDVFNALSIPMVKSITAALEECDRDDDIGAIILSGQGNAFCAGGDIKSMEKNLNVISKETLLDYSGDTILKIRSISKPVIAQVHNAAAGGGCNLALCCDFIIASEDARFIQSFVNVGLVPDIGGIYILSKYLNFSRLSEAVMTAKPIKAAEAYELGMVKAVVKKEELETECINFAKLLASKPRGAIKGIKEIMNTFLFDRLPQENLLERQFQPILRLSDNHREGVMAFVQKRTPEFNKKS